MDVTKLDCDYAIAGQIRRACRADPACGVSGWNDDRLSREESRYGDAGIYPQVDGTNGTLASLAVGAFVKLVTPWSSRATPETGLEWMETLKRNFGQPANRSICRRIRLCVIMVEKDGLG